LFVTQALPFSAHPLSGGQPVTLSHLLESGPAVVAFFKISCPTCQLAFPFLERLHAAVSGLQFIGISQDNADSTTRFIQRFGITFPILLDRASEGYPASNTYALTHVPSIFVIETDGAVSHLWTGFSKADFEKLALRAGAPVFLAADAVPVWQPG
jgi:peroxiredoxin